MSESIKTISSGSESWHHTKTVDEEFKLFEKYPAGDPELIRILKEYYQGFIVQFIIPSIRAHRIYIERFYCIHSSVLKCFEIANQKCSYDY